MRIDITKLRGMEVFCSTDKNREHNLGSIRVECKGLERKAIATNGHIMVIVQWSDQFINMDKEGDRCFDGVFYINRHVLKLINKKGTIEFDTDTYQIKSEQKDKNDVLVQVENNAVCYPDYHYIVPGELKPAEHTCVNAVYLADFQKFMNCDSVQIFGRGSEPCVLVPSANLVGIDANVVGIVMPCRPKKDHKLFEVTQDFLKDMATPLVKP
jgi:hypothetical protein